MTQFSGSPSQSEGAGGRARRARLAIRSSNSTATRAALVLLLLFDLARTSLAQVSPADLAAAHQLFTDNNFPAAAEATAKLIERLGPDQQHLRPTLTFNRACALLAADEPDKAAELFLTADSHAAQPALRASARYNLGQIAAKQAETLGETDRDKAIEAYRRAERHFRNALADEPTERRANTARNIESVQRRIAKLLDERKKDEQKQEQQDEKDKQDQKDQDKNDSKDKEDSKDKQDQKQDPSKPDDQGKDQSGEDKSEPKPGEDQKKEGDQKDAEKQKQDAEKQKQAAGADQDAKPIEMKPGDKREFDRAAAEILDKEKKQRERIRQMMRMMQRAQPVERDW